MDKLEPDADGILLEGYLRFGLDADEKVSVNTPECFSDQQCHCEGSSKILVNG
jgi:hypothetical protein